MEPHNFAVGFLLKNKAPTTNMWSNCLSSDPNCFLPERYLSCNFELESSHIPDSKSIDEEALAAPDAVMFSSSNLDTVCKVYSENSDFEYYPDFWEFASCLVSFRHTSILNTRLAFSEERASTCPHADQSISLV